MTLTTHSSRYNLASPSLSVEILEVISATPLIAMDLEISTHHASASQDTGNSAESSADTESAIPKVLGGS
jgi:hypothetical protein